MKRVGLIGVLLLLAAGIVYLQTGAPSANLAAWMPSGALLYLEAPDFSKLLHDWDGSQIQTDWLASADYDEFSRSNLFTKLQEVYKQYGAAAGYLPDLKSVVGIAGSNAALALYDFRDVEFLYITRIGNSDFMKSQLYAVRDKFEQRRAGGTTFYLRSDAGSSRTVAFAFVEGYLVLATRDDLVAQALELINGAANPNIAADHWFHDSSALATRHGELRLVMNLESLVRSVYFRSYWIQRNVSALRHYSSGLADIERTDGNIVENRIFLQEPDASDVAASGGSVSGLLALVPPDAGLYKAWGALDPGDAARLVVRKLIAREEQIQPDWRQAAAAASPDATAGAESELETRIDEQPLPADAGATDSIAAVRGMVEKNGVKSVLLTQSSRTAETFVEMPAVIVLEGVSDWDITSVRSSLAAASGRLWTTAQIGAAWTNAIAGGQLIERLDGLGSLLFAVRGHRLFLGNDGRLLSSVLNRAGVAPDAGDLTYAAGFRRSRESANYERITGALDFALRPGDNGRGPALLSNNIASLSRVFAIISEVRLSQQEQGGVTRQNIVYEMAR
jgi:hypothetical protein